MKKYLVIIIALIMTISWGTVMAQVNSKAVATATLNVRGTMSTAGDVLGTISQGQELEILGIEAGWARINYFGQPGYVLTEYIVSLTDNGNSEIVQVYDAEIPKKSVDDNQVENSEILFDRFSNISATWTCGFESFDKGYYGLRVESFFDNGIMYTFSFKGSWGVMTPGMFQWRASLGKLCVINKSFAFALPVSLMMGEYIKDAKYDRGKIKYEKDLCFGLIASPGLRIRVEDIIIGAQIDLGAVYGKDVNFYKGLEFSLGVKF